MLDITPEQIIAPLFRTVNCKDCKYGHYLGDLNWRWCEKEDCVRQVDKNKNGKCLDFVYGPPLLRRIKNFLRKHNKWCYWHIKD